MSVEEFNEYGPEGLSLRLQKLRDDYDEEILPEIIHTGPFKVRHAWFQSIIWDIDQFLLEYEKNISPKTLALIEQFQTLALSPNFKKRNTTKEDIELGNEVITNILSELENKQ